MCKGCTTFADVYIKLEFTFELNCNETANSGLHIIRNANFEIAFTVLNRHFIVSLLILHFKYNVLVNYGARVQIFMKLIKFENFFFFFSNRRTINGVVVNEKRIVISKL